MPGQAGLASIPNNLAIYNWRDLDTHLGSSGFSLVRQLARPGFGGPDAPLGIAHDLPAERPHQDARKDQGGGADAQEKRIGGNGSKEDDIADAIDRRSTELEDHEQEYVQADFALGNEGLLRMPLENGDPAIVQIHYECPHRGLVDQGD